MSTYGWLVLAAGLTLLGPTSGRAGRHGSPPRPAQLPPLPWLAGGLTAVATLIVGGRHGVVGASTAAVIAAVVGLLVRRLGRPGRSPAPPPRAVAFVLDLVASALSAGAPPEQAIGAVAWAVEKYGTAGLRSAVEPLGLVGRLLRLGTEPVQAWAALDTMSELAPVAAAGRRCALSGARLAGALAEVADELRARHRDDAVARAERIGVWALLPLGCCFLPAFVCIGVLPVVLAVAGQALGGA